MDVCIVTEKVGRQTMLVENINSSHINHITSLCLGNASYKYTMDEDTNSNSSNPLVYTYNTLKLISHHTVNNSYKLQ